MVKGTFRGKFSQKNRHFFWEETSYEIAKILGGFGQSFFGKSPYLGNGFLWILNM
jgi:hypothetical protein